MTKKEDYHKLVKIPEGMILDHSAVRKVRDHVPPHTTCSCGGTVTIVNNSRIYAGRSYGSWPWVYLCSSCRSYVGIHKGTVIPLGTLADKSTREARKVTKEKFFELVEIRRANDIGSMTGTYKWLAAKMDIPVSKCHFGMFDVNQCKLAEAYIELEINKDDHKMTEELEEKYKDILP